MSKKDKHSLEIECPHCEQERKISFKEDIECENCNKSLMGNTVIYKTNKTNLIVSALLGASVAAVLADKNVSADEILLLIASSGGTLIYVTRLKIEAEYKLMKICIDRFGTNREVRDTCFCTVKKLSTFVNAQMKKLKGDEWLSDQLDKQYTKCDNPKQLSSQIKN